jgi:hypothetical protein
MVRGLQEQRDQQVIMALPGLPVHRELREIPDQRAQLAMMALMVPLVQPVPVVAQRVLQDRPVLQALQVRAVAQQAQPVLQE